MEGTTATPDTKADKLPEGVSDVSFEEAKNDVAGPKASTGTPKAEADPVDILKPKKEPKTWTIGPEGDRRTYVQKEMSFLVKMQWFSLVGDVLDKAMSGPSALSINNLLAAPQGRGGTLSVQDFADADTFVQAVGKLLVQAPDFLERSFCLWLNVPEYERDVAREYMAQSPDEGGLSDDQGLEIIEIFIDQNYEALDTFFRERLGQLRDRVEAIQKTASESPSSRR